MKAGRRDKWIDGSKLDVKRCALSIGIAEYERGVACLTRLNSSKPE